MSLAIVSSPRYGEHLTPPGHPESPERAVVLEGVAARAADRGVRVVEPRLAMDEDLQRVHTAAHVAAVESTRGRAVMIDEDTFTSPETAEVARLAAGGVLAGVDLCLTSAHSTARGDSPRLWEGKEETPRVVVLVRPPGHHAEADRAMGFCFYNNVAIGAAYARTRGAARVAIVDVDVHHGNGTQHTFYADPDVLFVSAHQYPYYPGTGAGDELGEGDGRGYTVNLPMAAGATDGDYRLITDAVIAPLIDAFDPHLLIVSAGFDAHEDDPLGQMRVTTPGYAWLASRLAAMADARRCGLLVVTEGGYALGALAASLDATCLQLEGVASDVDAAPSRPATGRAAAAIMALRAAGGLRWAGL